MAHKRQKSQILQEQTSRFTLSNTDGQSSIKKKKPCQFGASLLEKYVGLQVQVHKFNYNKHDDNVVVMVVVVMKNMTMTMMMTSSCQVVVYTAMVP